MTKPNDTEKKLYDHSKIGGRRLLCGIIDQIVNRRHYGHY